MESTIDFAVMEMAACGAYEFQSRSGCHGHILCVFIFLQQYYCPQLPTNAMSPNLQTSVDTTAPNKEVSLSEFLFRPYHELSIDELVLC